MRATVRIDEYEWQDKPAYYGFNLSKKRYIEWKKKQHN